MTQSDLVMPKLGLTMTEGTVARWAIAPGARFAAGDVVAVVETDKIAYDVEAPGAGVLLDHLVAEGTSATVGTPIARWRIGSEAAPAGEAASPPSAAPIAATAPPARGPAAVHSSAPDGAIRVRSTPLARRLARAAGIDLSSLRTGGRPIKAGDVEQAIAASAREPSPEAVPPTIPFTRPVTSAAVTTLGTEVDVAAIEGLVAAVREAGTLEPRVIHFAVMAAARAASEAPDLFGSLPVIGISTAEAVSIIDTAALRRLSMLVIAMDTPQAGATEGGLVIADGEDASLIGAPPPPGWLACLGVGAVRKLFRPDAAGQPSLRSEVTLMLSARADAVSLGAARALLRRIRALLEQPLHLLVT